MTRCGLTHKEVTYERIVEAVAAIYDVGYAGAGVVEVTRNCGLTHSDFYVLNFACRDAFEATELGR
jgi:AcrR family transcriptional regulator